jgi:two-component system phosphate regulon sensor histidine kinase PhoR
MAGLIEVAIERMAPIADLHGVALRVEAPDALPDAFVDGERIAEALINLIDNGLKYTPEGGSVTVSAEVATLTGVVDAAGAAMGGSRGPASQPLAPAGPMLIVHVRDTGVGIGEDDLPRVFERFFKVDRARTRAASLASTNAASGQAPSRMAESVLAFQPRDGADGRAAGTGLGLAITRHLVELHGGRIWAESRLGQGSVFSFALPLA